MTKPKGKKRPHHGNLKVALVGAGIKLLEEGGLAALTLRKCAARSGVSHAAPAHHFNGLKDLLTAIVTEGFKSFTQTMISRRDGATNDPHARLLAVGKGYLDFSKSNEAMATLMFMTDKFFTEDADFQVASSASYQVLADACAPFQSGVNGGRDVEVMFWSLVQGYASLIRTGQVDAQQTPFEDILGLLNLRLR